MSKLHGQMAQIPCHPPRSYQCLSPSLYLLPNELLMGGSACTCVQAECWQWLLYMLHLVWPWKTVGGKNLSSGPICELSFILWKVKWPKVGIWILGGGRWPGHLIKDLEKKDWEIGEKEVWGRVLRLNIWKWAQSTKLLFHTLMPIRKHSQWKKRHWTTKRIQLFAQLTLASLHHWWKKWRQHIYPVVWTSYQCR